MAQTIFTLDARGNILLEVMQTYFGLDQSQMFREINASFSELQRLLSAKGIKYANLKNALIPCPDRNEVALIFDTARIEESWYGREIFDRILPALDRRAILSVLCGDYIGTTDHQDLLYDAFAESVTFVRDCTWEHSSQFFVVYINNLSVRMVQDITSALVSYEPFVGSADCNAPSIFKTLLSTMLVNAFLKTGSVVIQGHEDDRCEDENVNMAGYSFSENGYACKSIQEMMFGLFLGYKIERAVFPGFESDTMFSLNAISPIISSLEECQVQIEEAKLCYLQRQKRGSMKRAGIIDLKKDEVEARIRQRLANNYIFNMTYDEAHDVMKFNTILNFSAKTDGVVKLTAALEYRPVDKRLRLITMF
jgi:hypothetical protein